MHHFEMTADLNDSPIILILYDNDCNYVVNSIAHKIYTILLLSMNLNLIYQTVAKWWPFPCISYFSRFQTIKAECNVKTTYKNGHTLKRIL